MSLINSGQKYSYKHISSIVNTSSEYVHRVAKRMGIKSKKYVITIPRAKMVTLTCKGCGVEFQRLAWKVNPRSPGNYCSRKCFGKNFLGPKYGFGSSSRLLKLNK